MNSTTETGEALYDDATIEKVLRRVRGSGGLPLTDSHRKRLHGWYRILAKRGYTSAEFLGDPAQVQTLYKESFPNPNTRGQFVRSFLAYVSGLTDEEFTAEYPSLNREAVVKCMRKVNTDANVDSKARKAHVTITG